LEGGPPRFRPRFTGVVLLRYVYQEAEWFRLRDVCPLWFAVPRDSTTKQLGNSCRDGHVSGKTPYNPRSRNVWPLTRVWFGLYPLSLATTRGVFVNFLSSGY